MLLSRSKNALSCLRSHLVFPVVLGTSLCSIQPAQALTWIRQSDVPVVTSRFGGETRFMVAENLTGGPGQTVITVDTDGVQIVADGRTLSGPRDGSGVGIAVGVPGVGVRKVRIRGGQVTGFHEGILLAQATGCRVTDTVLAGNRLGLRLRESHRNLIRGNAVLGNSAGGIAVHDSSRNALVVNRILVNGGSGVEIAGGERQVLRGNWCSGNAVAGIAALNSHRDTLLGNHCHANVLAGIALGLFGSPAGSTTVRRNTTRENVFYGIVVYAGSTGNALRQNVADRNGPPPEFADAADLNPPGGRPENTWRGNRFGSATGPGLD